MLRFYAPTECRMGRLAAPKIPVIYLEAMEESTGEGKEPDKAGDAPVASLQKWELSEGILGNSRKRHSHPHHYKQETCSGRIL